MKIEELRVGIWVQIDDLPPEQVTLETLKTLAEHPSHISLFNGVELNGDWFTKFGFEIYPWGWVYNGLRITLMNYFERDGASHLKIDFVHQLQTLYFALTGKELEIK